MEYTPSAFRFFSYYFIAILTYNYLKIYGISSFHRMMKLFLLFNVAIAIVFGYLEVILNDVQFLNGAYRLSGTFKFHQLGNGMYLGALLILWFEFYLIKERKVKWLNVIIFLSLFYLFFNTHSRMLIVLLFFTYALYYIISVKKILKFIKISLLILGIAVSSILIIVKTDISPRLKTVFVSTESLRDPSTMERIEIFENTYNGMYLYQKIFGLGMGGFNKFYEEVTNRIGVAAHNNFLLFFAEGGGIGLFLFIVYQFSLFYTLVRFVRKQSTIKNQIYLARLCFVLIFVFEIGAFLLNNYYFFCSQAVVWIFMGYFTFINSRYNQIHHNKGLNETS